MATRTFINSAGGNWASAFSWSGSMVPGAGDTANITSTFAGQFYTVEVTDSEAAGTVNLGASDAELVIEVGATLTMTGTLNLTAGMLAVVSGGELSGATVDNTANSGSFIATDGILDNVTWLGNLDLLGVAQASLLTLTGKLTVFSDAPLVDNLPITKTLGQITPGNAGPISVDNRFNKQSIVCRRAPNMPVAAGQKILDPFPLVVA